MADKMDKKAKVDKAYKFDKDIILAKVNSIQKFYTTVLKHFNLTQ
jgi:hypothetical protein